MKKMFSYLKPFFTHWGWYLFFLLFCLFSVGYTFYQFSQISINNNEQMFRLTMNTFMYSWLGYLQWENLIKKYKTRNN